MWAHSAPCCLHVGPEQSSGLLRLPLRDSHPHGEGIRVYTTVTGQEPTLCGRWAGERPPSFSSPHRTGQGPRGCLRSHLPSPRLSLSASGHRSRGTSGSEWGDVPCESQSTESCHLPQPGRGRLPSLTEAWVLRQPRRTACRRKGFLKNKETAKLFHDFVCFCFGRILKCFSPINIPLNRYHIIALIKHRGTISAGNTAQSVFRHFNDTRPMGMFKMEYFFRRVNEFIKTFFP